MSSVSFNACLCEAESGRFLGDLSVTVVDRTVPSFSLGYWIRSSAARQGYITEAASVVVQHLVEARHANRIEIWCDARNLQSVRVAVRLGFEYEGTLRSARRLSGQLHDFVVFAYIPGRVEIAKDDLPG
jgi:RimJ/RimL family protein N-acetyltransferase